MSQPNRRPFHELPMALQGEIVGKILTSSFWKKLYEVHHENTSVERFFSSDYVRQWLRTNLVVFADDGKIVSPVWIADELNGQERKCKNGHHYDAHYRPARTAQL